MYAVTAVEMLTGAFPYKRSHNLFIVLSQVVEGPTPGKHMGLDGAAWV